MASSSGKALPGTLPPEEVFTYPFFTDEESKEFIKTHGRIMFIIRGPPGTNKGELNDLMEEHFPSGTVCSADDYRSKFPELGRKCHLFCQKMVEKECSKQTNPVIVSNTHIEKWEMQDYLEIAQNHEYVVIIASTMDKLEVSPEILAKSNNKGLRKEYFEKRLKAWQDINPVAMGWFLSPANVSNVFYWLQKALDVLLTEQQFRTAFNISDPATSFNSYKAKNLLWCMAGCMKINPFDLQSYYRSSEVRNSYGKCFTLSIHTFVVTKSHIFAAVQLDKESKSLVFKRNFAKFDDDQDEEDDAIVKNLFSVSLSDLYQFKLVALRSQFSKSWESDILDTSNPAEEVFNVGDISFIHLAQHSQNLMSPYDLNQIFRKIFTDFADENGQILCEKFREVEGGYAMCEAKKDAWLIRQPKALPLKAVFTGLYI